MGYLILILAIGFYFSRKKMNQSDYLLGGKKLPGWALAFSERATGESAWLILGYSGFAYAAGLSSIWIGVGCASGIIVSWIFLARKFREEADKYGAITLPGYFSEKFPERAKLINWFGSIIILFFFILYVAAQFCGAGNTLNVTFGIDVTTAIILASVVVIAYSILGGFMSVVWTDVVQSILMLIIFIVIPIVGVVTVAQRGLSMGVALAAAGPGFDSITGGVTGFAMGTLLFNNFAWFFGYMGGQPQLDARWMALKNDKEAKTARNIGITWTCIAYLAVPLMGIIALTLYGPNVVPNSEMILPHMIMDLTPPILAGVLLAGAIAAMMSTADSQLLVATASISEDIIHRALHKEMSQKKLVLISRLTVLVVGFFALAFAYVGIKSGSFSKFIYTVVGYAWAGIGCSFAPAILLSFYWDKFTSEGVVASLAVGLVTTIIWLVADVWELVPFESTLTARGMTFIFAFIAAVVTSLYFSKK